MATINFDNGNFENSCNNEYLKLCKKGQLIEAIKKYRDDTGCSLNEAKDYIDNLRSENGLVQPASGSGCMVVITGVILAITSLFFL